MSKQDRAAKRNQHQKCDDRTYRRQDKEKDARHTEIEDPFGKSKVAGPYHGPDRSPAAACTTP